MITHEQQLAEATKLTIQFLSDVEAKNGNQDQLTDRFVAQIREYPKDIIRQSIKQHFKLDNIIKYQVDENASFTQLAMEMSEYMAEIEGKSNEASDKDNA